MSKQQIESTFWRVCDEFGKCHCDWRYTIYDCEETYAVKKLYIVTAAASGLLAIIAVIILYFRLNYRNQKIFQMRNGFPRPKPIEAMGFFGIIFNLLQMTHAIIVLTNAIPNSVFRSFMFDISYQFGYSCFACYLFGVTYTLSESSRVLYSNWVKSEFAVNLLFLATVTLPFITNTVCAVAVGVYVDRGDNSMASKLTMAQYYLWTFYCCYLGALLLFAGIRLMRLLENHLLVQTELKLNIQKVKTGALKVKIIVVAGTSCMWIFAFLLGLYSACRDAVMSNLVTNMVVATVWLLAGAVASIFVEAALLINPNIGMQLGNLSFGSSSDSRMLQNQAEANDNFTRSGHKSLSFEFAPSPNGGPVKSDPSHRVSQLDDDIRYSFNTIKRPEGSMDILLLDEEYSHDNCDSTIMSNVEQEQQKYNLVTERVRTPPPPARINARNSKDNNIV